MEQRRVEDRPREFDDLPEEIVQPLARFGSALLEHVLAHRDHSLAEHEEGVLVHGAPAHPRCWKPYCSWRRRDSRGMRGRSRRGVRIANSGAACSPSASEAHTHAWVRFGCSAGGTTAGAAAASVLKRERGHLCSNAARMHYAAFHQQQLPIGSGAVEASAEHLLQHRMKRVRSRWSDLDARAILNLRCHLLSGRSLDRVALLPTKIG